ncbi:MAG: type II toxin-antitoxin system HicA family toxin [Candidatus Nomurabacteria bacterium]|nr:type II toxin-antitoxin system HicA family toxin [Candidatus Nomurabacteria bacterium]USN88150.1 MAG: type II toxin-antitoxin system HicA family toxin [Candidatus Nomurabacteria bacterium]
MSKKDKLVEKFLNTPRSIKYSQLLVILEYLEFEKIQAKGSHIKFKHYKLTKDLIIPVHNNECKDFYKEQAKSFIREIM